MIDHSSRYRLSRHRVYKAPDGRRILYMERRLPPQPENVPVVGTVTVGKDERIDLLAHRYLGDPTRFWLLADANGVLDPLDLVTPPGRRLHIPRPGG